MTTKNPRKALARHIQDELGISYSRALAVCDSKKPPAGWIVSRSEHEVAAERLRRATSHAAACPDDPAAQVLAAFAALRLLEPHAWAPRCDKPVAGIDPHSGDWTEALCARPFHLGPCAPGDILNFLWEQDMGPASQSFRSLVSHLRTAWRALGMVTDLDQRVRDLVRTVPSCFEEDEVWANIGPRAPDVDVSA